MELRVYPVPVALDREVARAALEPLEVRLEEQTEEQVKYAATWEGGTT
jgi:adenosylhomocysteinase